MRKLLLAAVALCLAAPAAFARPEPSRRSPLPGGMNQAFAEHDLVIAQCVSVEPQDKFAEALGFTKVHVKVLKVLHGDRKLGDLLVATNYPMKPGVTYMLSAMPAMALGSDFLATHPLSATPLPEKFDLAELDGKSLKDQIDTLWSRHLAEVNRQLFDVEREHARLIAEKAQLEGALPALKITWLFETTEPLKLGEIKQASTETDGKTTWLDLQGNKLLWSRWNPHGSKLGFLYYQKPAADDKGGWEFAPCAAATIGDLDGKRISARFYGAFTPRADVTGLKWAGTEAIQADINQVLFARTVGDPHTVYIIQIVAQSAEEARMVYRYVVIHD